MEPITSNKTILVIGGTGMLGRPVVRRLMKDSLPVRAFVRDMERARGLLPQGVDLIMGDLRNILSIDAALEASRWRLPFEPADLITH